MNNMNRSQKTQEKKTKNQKTYFHFWLLPFRNKITKKKLTKMLTYYHIMPYNKN